MNNQVAFEMFVACIQPTKRYESIEYTVELTDVQEVGKRFGVSSRLLEIMILEQEEAAKKRHAENVAWDNMRDRMVSR